MAFRWVSRCGGGLAGKPITRPRLPFIGGQARGSPSPPATPDDMQPRSLPALSDTRRTGASSSTARVLAGAAVRPALRDLLPRHTAAGIDVNPAQGESGSSPIPLHYRGGMIMMDSAVGIRTGDVAHRCCGEFSPTGKIIMPASAPSPAALLPLRPEFVYGPPHVFVNRNYSAASRLRRVGVSGAGFGFTMGGSSGPPLPERGIGSRCIDLMRHREIRIALHLYQQRRCMSSRRGGVPPRYGAYLKNGRIVLKRPAFLPTQAPDQTAAIKYWKSEAKVDGVVYESCLDGTSLLVKFCPEVYLKSHNLMHAIPILGESSDSESWKITEEGKYIIKSLIDLIGTFHDMGCCISGLAIDSLVISSAGKFEVIQGKVEFDVLTVEGVRTNYRTAVFVLEELIVSSMGVDMLDKLPEDIQHLFDLMEIDGHEYRYWIQNHLSLLPLQNMSTVFMSFFDFITLYIPNVATSLKGKATKYIPYRKIWAIVTSNNSYMVEWLKYQEKSRGMKMRGSRYELLHVVRNMFAHKLSLLSTGMLYENEDLENLLHAKFPMLMIRLQEFFWKKGQLRRFNLETFFMDRKVTQPWPRLNSSK